MTDNERDTHFLGFAQLLCDDEKLSRFLDDPYICSSGMRYEIIILIAQRAYDLVKHAVGETIGTSDISHIPDITEWPKSE